MLFPTQILVSTAVAASLCSFATARPFGSNAGLSSVEVTTSAEGKATCMSGFIQLSATATNVKYDYAGPANNSEVTEFFVEYVQANSTLATRITAGNQVVSGNYSIYTKLCMPTTSTANISTVQILTHGSTLDHTYWDFAPGYSYVDAAAEAGYATFSYDRLGTGLSDHPDPLQVVQVGIEVQILHELVQLLREGCIGNTSFKNFVGVGHSVGSAVTQGITTQFPKDFDAVILTGTSATLNTFASDVGSQALSIASTDPSGRFANLQSGYLLSGPIPQTFQFAYFREPFYDPAIFTKAYSTRQTVSIGEFLTLASAYVPSTNFTGPIDVVTGQYDWIYCSGDCTYPTDLAAQVRSAIYPASKPTAVAGGAGSQSYLVPDAGHNVYFHYNAPLAYAQQLAFLKANGL